MGIAPSGLANTFSQPAGWTPSLPRGAQGNGVQRDTVRDLVFGWPQVPASAPVAPPRRGAGLCGGLQRHLGGAVARAGAAPGATPEAVAVEGEPVRHLLQLLHLGQRGVCLGLMANDGGGFFFPAFFFIPEAFLRCLKPCHSASCVQ